MLRLMKIFLPHSKYIKEILDVAYTVHDVRFNLLTRFKFQEIFISRRGYIECNMAYLVTFFELNILVFEHYRITTQNCLYFQHLSVHNR